MNDLLPRLQALTGMLEVAEGLAPETLADLRRRVAACLIHEDPTRSPAVADPAYSDAMNLAAAAGDALAAEQLAAGVRLRFLREPYLAQPADPARPMPLMGPFTDGDGTLAQFSFFETTPMRSVVLERGVIFRRTILRLPQDTFFDGAPTRLVIPVGTVWLAASLVVRDTPGFVALRVAGGALAFDRPVVQNAADGHFYASPLANWTLTLQPEAAAPATAEGSDGNALGLQLPAVLTVTSRGSVEVAGPIGMAGFGGDLSFDTPIGQPLATEGAIVFAYDPAGAQWAIDGNRSPLTQFTGAGHAQTALWTLPLTQTAAEPSGEAAHGGSVAILLQGELRARTEGVGGPMTWSDIRVVANSGGLEVRGRRAQIAAHLSLTLWGPARSELDFGPDVASVRFASRRDGADVVSWAGGRLRNRWDLPRDARGEPFDCEASIGHFATVREPAGLRRLVLSAQAQPPTRRHGFVLENAYLSVSPIRTLALAAGSVVPGGLASGVVRLVHDVTLGEPMLPDPYAANWSPPEADADAAVEGGLSVLLRWQPDAAPTLRAQLEQPVRFPEPRDIAPESAPLLGERFRAHLHAQPEFLGLLDLSTRDHQFGIALESPSDLPMSIDDANLLSAPLRSVRLLMEPQVHWEPVVDMTPPASDRGLVLRSGSQGGHTLAGADGPQPVPLLPGVVAQAVMASANRLRNAAMLFSLPFGLRAYVRFDRELEPGANRVPPVIVFPHEPQFDAGLVSARQLRLLATGGLPPGDPSADAARGMPGAMHQTPHLENNPRGLTSVLGTEIETMVRDSFDTMVPLHAADLSGRGLSCFSHWHRVPANARDDVTGVSKVQFDVLCGRTVFEVIEVRSLLVPCQSRVVRTLFFERRNSGRIQRFDTGWQAVDAGLYQSPVPFHTGALRGLHNIRRIRILDQPLVTCGPFQWQPVRFDADAMIDGLVRGGQGGLTPAPDQAGFIQILPVSQPAPADNSGVLPTKKDLAALFDAVAGATGGTIGGSLDCTARIGGTLDMHLHGLQAAVARDDMSDIDFVVALRGSPVLPRAGQWSAVRIDGLTSDVSAVDARQGIPVVQLRGQPFRFRDPGQARLVTGRPREYGLLFSNDTSRVLFPTPSIGIGPGDAGRLDTAPPLLADPTALTQGSGYFPRRALALQARDAASFDITAGNAWRLATSEFAFDPPLPGVASGAGWVLDRTFGADAVPPLPNLPFKLDIDSAVQALPWQLAQPADVFDIKVDGLGTVLSIESAFKALGGAAGKLDPLVRFGKVLAEAENIVNGLQAFAQLPAGFKVAVDVAKGAGDSLVVRMNLNLTIGGLPDGRVDIGLGKFFGSFTIEGRFEAAVGGATQGHLTLLFDGDVQQAVIPPLLYAGGMFHFRIEVGNDGPPVIELGLGTATSIGGDLIKGLLAVEATVKYGYTLIPQSLKPGVMLGIEARAKLLAGLFSMCFSADALARIERFNSEDKTVTIFADIRVAGSVHVAVFFDESFDFQTQFEQRMPLAPLLIAANVNPLLAVAANALI